MGKTKRPREDSLSKKPQASKEKHKKQKKATPHGNEELGKTGGKKHSAKKKRDHEKKKQITKQGNKGSSHEKQRSSSSKKQEQKVAKKQENLSIAKRIIARATEAREKKEAGAMGLIRAAEGQENVKFFNRLISDFGSDKMLPLSIQAYRAMRAVDVTPDAYTLTNLVHACVLCDEIDLARQFIDEMSEYAQPNEVTYTALIKGLVLSGAMQEAWGVVEMMIEEGLQPNYRTFNALLRGCVCWGDAVMAEQVWQGMYENDIQATDYNYLYMMKVYGQNGRIDLLTQLVEGLQSADIVLTSSMLSFLSMIYALHGQEAEARKMLTVLSQTAREERPSDDSFHANKKGRKRGKGPGAARREREKQELFIKIREHDVEEEVLRVKDYLAGHKRKHKKVQAAMANLNIRTDPKVLFFNKLTEAKTVTSPVNLTSLCGPRTKKTRYCLEICMGHGDWILHRAQEDPNVRWFGLEIRFDRVHQTWCKALLKGIDNVWLLNGDAQEILEKWLPSAGFDHVYINHPEPPISQDSKKQLVTGKLLTDVARILKPKGSLTILTDDTWYAVAIAQILTEDPSVSNAYESLTAPEPFLTEVPDSYGTSYFDYFFNNKGKFKRYFMQYALV